MNTNIISILIFQLDRLLNLMNQDASNGFVTVNYFICEDEVMFLDYRFLQEYLTKTKIENDTFLIEINKRCLEVIDLWNNHLSNLPDRKFEEYFNSNNISTSLEFYAIYLKEFDRKMFSSKDAKLYFTNNYNYNHYQISSIANKCSKILNYITACYPKTGEYVVEKYYFNRYLKSKSFYFQAYISSFKTSDYNFATNKVKEFKNNFRYIYENLDNSKDEFKYDTIDHLNKVLLAQKHLKFKELIQSLINDIKEITPILKTLPPSKTSFTFTNNFDKLEPNKVYEYFYKLVEKGYLSKEDLENYLILAFQDRTPPKEKTTFSNKHIGNITAIFYKYYTDADSPHGKQKQYAELLGEYFKSFTTKKVINNFAKSK